MGLETGSFIPELVDSNPDGVDPKSEGDNHLRLIKTCVQGSFPAFVGTTAVPKFVGLTEDELTDAALKSAANVFTERQTIVDNNLLFSAASTFLTGLQFEDSLGNVREWELLDDRTSGADLIFRRYVGGILQDSPIKIANATGQVILGFGGNVVLATASGGVAELRSAQDLDNENRFLAFQHQDGTIRGRCGYVGSSDIELRNQIPGGTLDLFGQTAGDVGQTLAQFDPDGGCILRTVGAVSLITEVGGAVAIRSVTNTDAEPRQILFSHQDGTLRGFVGFGGDPNITLENRINGGQMLLRTRDAGAASRVNFLSDPDGETEVNAGTNFRVHVNGFNQSGLICRGGSRTELYFNAILRWNTEATGAVTLTSDGSTDTENRLIDFQHANGISRGFVGYSGAPDMQINNTVNGGRVLLVASTSGGVPTSQITCDPDVGVILPVSGVAQLGFFGSAGTVKPTITGAKGANEALTSLMPALAAMGLVIDNTTF